MLEKRIIKTTLAEEELYHVVRYNYFVLIFFFLILAQTFGVILIKLEIKSTGVQTKNLTLA